MWFFSSGISKPPDISFFEIIIKGILNYYWRYGFNTLPSFQLQKNFQLCQLILSICYWVINVKKARYLTDRKHGIPSLLIGFFWLNTICKFSIIVIYLALNIQSKNLTGLKKSLRSDIFQDEIRIFTISKLFQRSYVIPSLAYLLPWAVTCIVKFLAKPFPKSLLLYKPTSSFLILVKTEQLVTVPLIQVI